MKQLERCRPWLEAALQPHVSFEELADDLANDRAMLWPGERSALVTQIIEGDIHCWLGGGDMTELLDMRTGVEAVGRLMGCTYATVQGRKGWIRIFRRFGYELVGHEMRKKL